MRSLFLIGLATFSTCALSAEYGMGIGLVNSGGMINFSVDLTPALRIDPYFSYSRNKTEGTQSSVDYGNSYRYTESGFGIFFINNSSASTKLQLGMRIGYLSHNDRTSDSGHGYSINSSGYSIAPTAGVEYFVLNNISIGGEAALVYSRANGNSYNQNVVTTTDRSFKETNYRTRTAVTVRYYFD